MDTRKVAWVTVVTVALGLSNWSIAYVAHRWGVPGLLTYTVSAVFDGVAVLMADLALKAARLGDSTFAPSAFLFLFGGASAYFNAWHAKLAGLPMAAMVFFAFPPVAALVAVELELRHDRRQALKDMGRIAAPLPAFGGATWALKPIAAYRAVRAVVKYRLAEKRVAATGTRLPQTAAAAIAGQPAAGGGGAPRVRRPRKTGTGDRATAGIAADMDAGLEVSKRVSAAKWNVSEYVAEQILKDLRKQRSNGDVTQHV